MTLDEQTQTAELPGGRLLNYVGSVNTPTRARRVASTAVMVVGVIQLIIAVVLVGFFVARVIDRARSYATWARSAHVVGLHGGLVVTPGSPMPEDYLKSTQRELEMIPPELVLGLPAAFFGLLLLLFHRAVNRGQKVPCYLCLASVIPLMCAMAISSAGFGALGLMFGVGLFREPPSWRAVPCLAGIVVCGLIVLLMKDLCGFLRWIAKQPSAEKPAVPFLAVKAPGVGG